MEPLDPSFPSFIQGFSMPEAGESYSAAGVNYERLQEEVLAGEANVKELQPMPSSSSTGKM